MNTQCMDRSLQSVALFNRISRALKVVGVLSIVLGCSFCVAGLISQNCSLQFALACSALWAADLLALVNGAVALKAGLEKPRTSAHWVRVNLGFGVLATLAHLAAFAGCVHFLMLFQLWFDMVPASGIRDQPMKLAFAVNVAQLVMCVLLVVVDIGQLVAVVKARLYYNEHPEPAVHAIALSSEPAQFATTGYHAVAVDTVYQPPPGCNSQQ